MIPKALVVAICSLVLVSLGWSATVTVPGNAPTINAALELIDYNDGEADLVLIGPGIYDEQVVPKGNAGIDSEKLPPNTPSFEAIENAVTSHPDPLTLKALDPAHPPVLTVKDAPVYWYALVPYDFADFWLAGLVLAAKDVTLSGLEIRHGTGTTRDVVGGGYHYAMWGMASAFVFEDCLFTNGLTEQSAHFDFCDYGSWVELTDFENPNIGLNNEFTYNNCIIDGASVIDGHLYNDPFVYFHGYSGGVPDAPPLGGHVMSNCIARNWENRLFNFNGSARVGAGGGLANVFVEDCFFRGIEEVFAIRGPQGPFALTRSVFDSIPNFAVLMGERLGRGFTGDFTVTSNLFTGQTGRMLAIEYHEPAGSPEISIVNNTFWNYQGTCVEVGGDRGGSLLIANNIFAGSEEAFQGTGIDIQNGTPTIELLNNGYHNTTFRTGLDPATDEESLNADPMFTGTELNIPMHPPPTSEDRLQEFNPTNRDYVDTGNQSIYSRLPAFAIDADVDRSHDRIRGNGVDRGAQETDGDENCPVVGGCPTFTPSNTPSVTSTPTPTATPTATHTPDPSDLNLDGAIDAMDLLILLSDWKKTSGV